MNRLFLIFLFIMVCGIGTIGIADASLSSPSSFISASDTQIKEDSATSNFGTSAVGGLKTATGSRKELLVSFGSGNLGIPSNATITSATVKLTIYSVVPPVGNSSVESHNVNSSWAETGVTWSNFNQNFSSTVSGSVNIVNGQTGAIFVPVTSIVQSWVNGGSNNGILFLENSTSTAAIFYTRENGASTTPTLSVSWTVPNTCSNSVKDNLETDVDCGGGTCAACSNTKICNINSDCTSGLCYNHTCYPKGTPGAVVSTCTLPSLPATLSETNVQYKPLDAVYGWGVLTLPPVGTSVIGWVDLIHPGAWNDGSTGVGTGSNPWANNASIVDTRQKLAGLGYVVFSPEHRSAANIVHPAQISDIMCSMRFVRDYMVTNSLPSKGFVMGTSTGAHLAVLAALSNNTFDDGTCPLTGPVTVNGAIGWSGGYDLTQTDTTQSTITTYLGYTSASNPAGALAASPITYPDPLGDPDILLIHGTADFVSPYSQSQNMYNKAINSGVNATLVLLTGSNVHAGPLFDSTLPSQGCTALSFLNNH